MPVVDSSPPVIWEPRPPEFRALFQPLPDDPSMDWRKRLENIKPADLGDWIERLGRAGIAVDRPTSPDLPAQLRAALRRPIDTVICSCLDEDPLLRPNAVMAGRYPHALTLGVELLAKLCNARRVLTVLDADAPGRWHVRLRHVMEKIGGRVCFLPNEYPASDPTLLLRRIARRRLPPGRSPAQAGVVMLDAAAAVMVGQALELERLENWPCAIRDHITEECHYLSVGQGRVMGHVLHEAGIHPAATVVWAGRPIRQKPAEGHAALDGSGLAFHAMPPAPSTHPQSCIRCGWCIEICPVNINPALLLEASQYADSRLARGGGLDACIECGLCTYVCPSHLPLLDGIRSLRASEEPSDSRQG